MTNVVIVIDFLFAAAAVAAGGWLALRGRPVAGLGLRGRRVAGLTLVTLAGGSLAAAAVVLLTGDIHTGRLVSVEAGVVLAAWGAMTMSVTGYRHWAQLAPVLLGVAVVVLSFALKVPG